MKFPRIRPVAFQWLGSCSQHRRELRGGKLGRPGGSWYTTNRDYALALAMEKLIRAGRGIFPNLSRNVFPNKLGLEERIASWELKKGFLMKNCVYGLIPRSKLAD